MLPSIFFSLLSCVILLRDGKRRNACVFVCKMWVPKISFLVSGLYFSHYLPYFSQKRKQKRLNLSETDVFSPSRFYYVSLLIAFARNKKENTLEMSLLWEKNIYCVTKSNCIRFHRTLLYINCFSASPKMCFFLVFFYS